MLGRITLDGTDVEVSRLGFGTGSLHHLLSARRRQRLLEEAGSAGITHFDTAPYYGYGLAERDLGRYLRGRRSRLTVATKVGLYPLGPASGHIASVLLRKAAGRIVRRIAAPVVDRRVERAEASLHASLRRLSTDHVDFLFLHEPDPTSLEADETSAWLERERRRGSIRAWGLAGLPAGILPLVRQRHPLAMVVQTQDSLDLRQADFLADSGRKMQITYGYLSRPHAGSASGDPATTIREALGRNTTGCVLVSTRSVDHLRVLVGAVR
jgi:aryl-alcohol dehydrogenase-like predicted oxidoreductase